MANEHIADGPASPVPPELLALMELGKQGKLWAVTIQFSIDSETRSVIHRNLTNKQVMKIRADVFIYGFLHPISAGSWRIIPPMDITGVYLDRQSGYFPG